VVVYFGTTATAPWLDQWDTTGCFTGWESHCVRAYPASSSPGGYASIVATGTGDRGAIYGAYTFAETILGVEPWWRFADFAPPYTPSVQVNDTLTLLVAPPKFKYRAWFPNDEDLLAGLRPDPLKRGVFDSATWDALCETMLRLKGNAMLIGTNPYPDDASVAMVGQRGVVVMQHHYDLLGVNVFQVRLAGIEGHRRAGDSITFAAVSGWGSDGVFSTRVVVPAA
jgi:hypothetical protein